MSNPSSNFLRGAKGGADDTPPAPDETTVLTAIGRPEPTTHTIFTLATALRTTPGAISEIVGHLIGSGLVRDNEGALTLTEAGERAVRYANVAKF
jgi:Mn-dependent DtxR family transcriptional regulator